MPQLIRTKGQVQAYQWGGFEYLPKLLQYTNSGHAPQAEYWLGVHRAAPSNALINEQHEPLADILQKHNCRLDFLLKILDVREMLSIQVHPTKIEAQRGFAEENQQGIPLAAKHRNYKDDNHKPELMVALSEFWLLHGFADETTITRNLNSLAYLSPLLEEYQNKGLRKAFELALNTDNEVIQQINLSLQAEFGHGNPINDKTQIEFWIQRWLSTNPDALNGLLTLYFLNLVKVEPGQALYQPSGLLHAYLEGQNVELMANSDNVLRAGLTPKHIDVTELLKICKVETTQPQDYFIQPTIDRHHEQRFPTPFEEFELSEFHSQRERRYEWQSSSVEILLCMQGQAQIQCAELQLSLKQGDAVLVLPNNDIKLQLNQADTQIYKAKNLLA